MPFYDLRCTKCNKEFNIRASMSERSENKISCPECGSSALDAVFKSANYSIKGSGAGECPNSHICGASCCH